jgi:hypothetical protein
MIPLTHVLLEGSKGPVHGRRRPEGLALDFVGSMLLKLAPVLQYHRSVAQPPDCPNAQWSTAGNDGFKLFQGST